jgi:hypothetical protein
MRSVVAAGLVVLSLHIVSDARAVHVSGSHWEPETREGSAAESRAADAAGGGRVSE